MVVPETQEQKPNDHTGQTSKNKRRERKSEERGRERARERERERGDRKGSLYASLKEILSLSLLLFSNSISRVIFSRLI
ncbi:hypothetical protein SDJN03_18061, partial [Cucurbita argyrosperma subsp. sororia]